jgi:hypothetical protein
MGVSTLMRVLRRLFQLPAGYAEAGKSLEELDREYRKWKWILLTLFFLLFPLLAGAWWWILNQVGILIAGRFADAVFQLRMTKFAWILPSLPLGMLTSALPLNLFARWRLKGLYSEYVRYECLDKGYDCKAAAVPTYLFFSAILLLFLLSLFHWRAVFTKDEIVIYPFWSLSSVRHSYQDIAEIRTAPQCKAPSGKIVNNVDQDHVLQFSDGYRWSTYWIWGETDDNEKRRLIDFISTKSSKPVRQLAILEDR